MQLKAHPRSRGENYATARNLARPSGSSPLTRGKRIQEHTDQVGIRLIPAHAGKTATPRFRLYRRGAHPRSRGENVRIAQYSPPSGGSSPLTRGKPDLSEVGGTLARLIPAHAGKTRSTAATPIG